MPATNSNNARWFMLCQSIDFEPRIVSGAADPLGPRLENSNLFFDDSRRVLELIPVPLHFGQSPLPGWASTGLGEEYSVDPQSLRISTKLCDGTLVPFPADPCITTCAAGLAIDRRGFLYVADPGQRAVIVIDPPTQHVEARLTATEMIQPVDVAVAADGRIYAADTAAGKIFVFSGRFSLLGSWPAKNADDLPSNPRPIAVMIAPDSQIIVADAAHPRLLKFSSIGEPLGDLEVAAISTGKVAEACVCIPQVAPCPQRGCEDPNRPRDVFDVIVELHRNYRLDHLRLRSSYRASGVWQSRVLDSGLHDMTWHKLEFDADIPAGCAIRVQTASENDRSELLAKPKWLPEGTDDDPFIPLAPGAPEVLVKSPPGRFLRLRVTLLSKGRAIPSIRGIRVLFPRNSYLDLLPRIYRATMGADRFLERFLALFEYALTRVEDRYEEFSRLLNPNAAPAGMVAWLAGLLDLAFDKDWPLERRRALLLKINELYAIKGTPRGIREYILAYTGLNSLVQEEFLRRPAQPPFLGRRGFVLGTTSLLNTASAEHPADKDLYLQFAHRFTVRLYVNQDPCSERLLGVVERIVSANKPAHTIHTIVPVYPGAKVGTGSRVGIDLVLAGKSMPGANIGACDQPGKGEESTLGLGMILSDANPAFVRPRGHRL